MLDAFDFTIFLLIMVPIANEFGISVTLVASALTVTLWLRLIGAVASGWLADRIGRKAPLMLAILWFSASNFVAGFSPSFMFLFIVRAALGSLIDSFGEQLSQVFMLRVFDVDTIC